MPSLALPLQLRLIFLAAFPASPCGCPGGTPDSVGSKLSWGYSGPRNCVFHRDGSSIITILRILVRHGAYCPHPAPPAGTSAPYGKRLLSNSCPLFLASGSRTTPGTEECSVSICCMDGWGVRTLETVKCWATCAGAQHCFCAEVSCMSWSQLKAR